MSIRDIYLDYVPTYTIYLFMQKMIKQRADEIHPPLPMAYSVVPPAGAGATCRHRYKYVYT